MANQKHTPLPGSERSAPADPRAAGGIDANERIAVTVLVRPRAMRPAAARGDAPIHERQYLSRAELADVSGADPADIDAVAAFARANGLEVVETSIPRRSVVLAGTVAAMSAAFGVTLERYSGAEGTYRGRSGPLHVPADLAPIIQAVLGLDDRPQAQPQFRILMARAMLGPQAADGTFTPPQLAQLYDFPADADGRGQTIALIELGGGYRKAEVTRYFSQLGLKPPAVTSALVDKARNRPAGDPRSADGEVLLDIEVAGAMAPGARIVVYFAPNTDRGFLDAITTAIHDTRRHPNVISISWGAPESAWTAQAMQAFDQAFQDAAALGVTICCASGDNGSSDGVGDGRQHVDFPAASPYALACGGTHIEAQGAQISREVIWNGGAQGGATGGGVSDVFPLPAWQSAAHVPASANGNGRVGRGVPDVAGNADPATGYQILVDGQHSVFGGTSAVAPLWAALIARLNQQIGKPAGHLNPLLYGSLRGSCRDITSGNNGAYSAKAGWDACSGLGSPNGAKLLQALKKSG